MPEGLFKPEFTPTCYISQLLDDGNDGNDGNDGDGDGDGDDDDEVDMMMWLT